MKKLLFLLLCTVSLYGQTYQNPTFGTVKTKTSPTVTSVNHLATVEADGTIAKIDPVNLPFTQGSGTVNTIPVFTGTKTLGNSIISQSGTNIGISTPTPQATLHLADANAIYLDRYQAGTPLLKPNIFLRNFGGTFASPTALPADAPIGALAFSAGYTSSATTGQPPNAQIVTYAKGAQSVSAHGGQLEVEVTRSGTISSEKVLILGSDETNLAPINNTAKVTVGLPAPNVGAENQHKFQVVSQSGYPTVSFGNYGTNAGFHGWASRGTYAAPTKLLSGDALFSFGFRGWGDTGLQGSSGSMTVYATEDFTDTAQGTRVIIQTNANGHNATLLGRTSTFEFGQDGAFTVPYKIGIGTTSPTNGALDIKANGVALSMRGVSVGDTEYMSFYNSAGTRRGYFGFASSGGSASNMTIANDEASGHIVFNLQSSGYALVGTTTPINSDKLQVNGNATFSGTVKAATPVASNDLTTKAYVDGIARPYKVYTALIAQSGTSAPTVTVLENTLGGTVVWTRTGAGLYEGTLPGAFTASKTVCFATKEGSTTSTLGAMIYIGRNGGNGVTLRVQSTALGFSDSLLTGDSIEIRVYN